jgi:subtilase family serine protease
MALIRTDVKERRESQLSSKAPVGSGYGPSQLDSAYQLPSSGGAGEAIAVIDAYDDPNAVSDLATYRQAWGLPACDSSSGDGCVTKVNQSGQTSPLPAPAGDTGWGIEESTDVDMVSAICPLCQIYLVEAQSKNIDDLAQAVRNAVDVLGVDFVSNSYGTVQSKKDLTLDVEDFDNPGVAVVASAGDFGYRVAYPAASPYVTAVGGTTLTRDSKSPRGWKESVWPNTGSGCSKFEPKPPWQKNKGCSKRTDNDVAAVAAPGVAVYDTYDSDGWTDVAGTSVATPIVASIYALAGPPSTDSNPASFPYEEPGDLYDVTTGSNGTCALAYLCRGEPGYDGPTGLGTPDGIGAFSG